MFELFRPEKDTHYNSVTHRGRVILKRPKPDNCCGVDGGGVFPLGGVGGGRGVPLGGGTGGGTLESSASNWVEYLLLACNTDKF